MKDEIPVLFKAGFLQGIIKVKKENYGNDIKIPALLPGSGSFTLTFKLRGRYYYLEGIRRIK